MHFILLVWFDTLTPPPHTLPQHHVLCHHKVGTEILQVVQTETWIKMLAYWWNLVRNMVKWEKKCFNATIQYMMARQGERYSGCQGCMLNNKLSIRRNRSYSSSKEQQSIKFQHINHNFVWHQLHRIGFLLLNIIHSRLLKESNNYYCITFNTPFLYMSVSLLSYNIEDDTGFVS